MTADAFTRRYASPASTTREELEPLADLVARVDLVHLVGRYAGEGKREGNAWLFVCPNPAHDDRHPSFRVAPDNRGVWRGKCWSGCNWSGDALGLMKWLHGMSTGDAANALRKHLGEQELDRKAGGTSRTNSTSSRPSKEGTPPKSSTPGGVPADLPETTRPTPEVAARVMAEHLDGRGWPAEVEELYGLEVVLDQKKAARIRYPFYAPGPEGIELSTWQDRAAGWRVKPKFLAPAGRKLPPFNLATLESLDITAVVITEGPPDAITAGLALRGRAEVAVIGIAGTQGWRPEYAELVAGLRVLVVADDDDAGALLARTIPADLEAWCEDVRTLTTFPREAGDLTEYGKTAGLEAVRELVLDALDLEDEVPAEDPPLADLLAMVHAGPASPDPKPSLSVVCPACRVVLADAPGRLCMACRRAEDSGPNSWRWCSHCHRASLTTEGQHCRITPWCTGRLTLSRKEVAA